jgi:vancomycin permeability regulator SanA
MHVVIRSLPSFATRIFLWFRVRVWWILGGLGICIVLISVAPIYAVMTARGEEFSATNVPKHDVAIVFGAGVYPDGTPTPFLQSRLLAAIQLYKDGKVRVLLMSGDNRTSHYDEPTAMKKFAVAHGVPARAVVLDYAGYDTYDTCYRVHYLFGVNSAILVTHGYHLPRALLTCNSLGIKSVGVKADRANSSFSKNYLLREVLSTNKAVIQLIFKFNPGVLGPKLNTLQTALAQSN